MCRLFNPLMSQDRDGKNTRQPSCNVEELFCTAGLPESSARDIASQAMSEGNRDGATTAKAPSGGTGRGVTAVCLSRRWACGCGTRSG